MWKWDDPQPSKKFTNKGEWYTHPVTKAKYIVQLDADGKLRRIKVRVIEKRSAMAGGDVYYNKLVWDYNTFKGERPDKIVTLLAELGIQGV